MTTADAGEGFEVPAALLAVEVKVYEVPLVRPVTVHEPEAAFTLQTSEPGVDVTVKDVGTPPVPAGTTVIVAWALPTTTVGAPGVSGGTFTVGVTLVEAVDAEEEPAPLLAVTVNVYDVPGVRPVTGHEVAGGVTVQEPPAGKESTV